MSEMPIKHGAQLQSSQQRKHSGLDEPEWTKGYGSYQYVIPAQDQIIAFIAGMKISGTFTSNQGDSQSDYTAAPSAQLIRKEIDTISFKVHQIQKELNRGWEAWKSLADEEPAPSVTIEEQVGGQAVDTETDDVSQWSSEQLASAILHSQAGSDMVRLREMIVIAEDVSFTVGESEQLAPWLLNFAQKYRDSNDPQNEAAVWSAIRTGASMLRPHAADCLRPLLEPGHSIETSLVTVKMVGRIFEAQPPPEIDKHPVLAEEVLQIAESQLNPYSVTISKSAAMAQLAIYALAAMASSKIYGVVKDVQSLNVAWFTQQTLRELRELENIWANRPVPVAERPCELLRKTIQMLEHD